MKVSHNSNSSYLLDIFAIKKFTNIIGKKTEFIINTNQVIQLNWSVSKSISPYKEKKSYLIKVLNPSLSDVVLTNITVIANIKDPIINKKELVVKVTAINIWMTFLNFSKIQKYVNPLKNTTPKVMT